MKKVFRGVSVGKGSPRKRRAQGPAGNAAVMTASGSGHRVLVAALAPEGESPSEQNPTEEDRNLVMVSPGPAPTLGPRKRKRKAHSLIDKVYLWNNLYRAWRRVRSNKGAHGLDRVTIHQFEADWEMHLREIQRKLMQRRFEPQPVRRVYIPKASNPKERRPLGIPVVADRIVQQALLQVLDPLFDHEMSDRSFGFRKGRKAHDAIATVIRDAKEGGCKSQFAEVERVKTKQYRSLRRAA